jgi:hypothetical protein
MLSEQSLIAVPQSGRGSLHKEQHSAPQLADLDWPVSTASVADTSGRTALCPQRTAAVRDIARLAAVQRA